MAVIPTTGVDLSTEVGQVLNDAGGSVIINQALTYFTESAKINRWAKYKPLKIDKPFIDLQNDKINVTHPITSSLVSVPAYYGDVKTQTKLVSTSKGTVVLNVITLGGFDIPESINNTDLQATYVMDEYATNGCNWEYHLPVSGTDYLRLGDFRGYNTEIQDPFYFEPPSVIYESDTPMFYYATNNEFQNGWWLTDMMEYLSSNYRYAVIVKNSLGSIVATSIGELLSDSMFSTGHLSIGQLSSGIYKAYFVAIDRSNSRVLLLPSSSDYPNPSSFTVKAGDNPSVTPSSQISITGVGFAFSRNSSYWGTFDNVGEGDYIHLCTNHQLAIKQEWVASENTAPTIDFTSIDWEWAYCGSGNDNRIAGFNVYINGVNYTGKKFTFQAGVTYTVIFELVDIYYSKDSSTTSKSEGEYFTGNSFDMILTENHSEYFYIDIQYDPYHNGYIYNSANDEYIQAY